ncbi:MAG: HPr family phosphocarrier protein [Betaproteobacteria bacterium]|nr:HPr family phosphocarrier protein [Betaproteobacteria bacterium]MDE2124808.1 HPr family phosphocarrier protein [Betaproteobacteria bacterium]MDE2187303.1 HPr family phosphocarrier protein [Betaproteobacteria bacterium]MDE2323463.1 HPr family phosphocarrier protein [Betaproteobacteria bacterium]
MLKRELLISNKLGLHARASAKLTKLASEFGSEIWISRGSRRVNAKSIMGVMMLAAGQGTRIGVEADGADAQQALDQLTLLVDDKFGEGE